METISELISRHSKPGRVEWIGVRPQRRQDMVEMSRVEVTKAGLLGDHYAKGGKRSVTLIQKEHIAVIASLVGLDEVKPELLRRNLVVSGINLLGLRNRQFQVGEVVLEGTGLCAPCSRMEENLGHGGYSAVRGHGGITARIVADGKISTDDQVSPL